MPFLLPSIKALKAKVGHLIADFKEMSTNTKCTNADDDGGVICYYFIILYYANRQQHSNIQ